MEAKKIYEDIVISFYNVLRNEKLRTNIVLDLDFKEKTKTLVTDLLALEHDHDCSFKDEKWSQTFAKAIVNITKEKIKFEKPDEKSLTDIYADYAELLTYSLNIFEVSKETLMNGGIEITAEEVKLNSKVTAQMREQYQTVAPTPVVEIVDQKKEKPNNGGQNQNFNNNQGFAFNQEDIPVPPFQNPRFYQFKTKPKFMKHLKLALGVTFILLTVIFISLEIVIISNRILIPTSNTYFDSWEFLGVSKPENVGVPIMTLYTGSASYSQSSIFLMIMLAVMGFYISTNSFMKPRIYRDQYYFPYLLLLSAALFAILCGAKFLFNGSIWKAMVGKNEFLENLKAYFEAGFKASSVTNTTNITFEADVAAIYTNYVDGKFSSLLINAFLWVEAVIFFLTFAIIIVIVSVNPRLDREKISRANQEYQKAISELMQGRPYEMDQSLFEDKDEIEDFYRNVRKRNQDSQEK